MSSEMLIFSSCVLTFGVPLVLAAWELVALRRDARGGGSWNRDRARDTSPTPGPDAGVRPLPDCLIPKPLPTPPVRARELEHA